MSLLEIVYDLLHSKQVRKKFSDDPIATIDPYDLDEAKKSALFSMDPLTIAKEIEEELKGERFTFMKGEFLECEFRRSGGATAEYPSPKPLILGLSHMQRPVAEGPFELSVYGQSFSRDAVFKLENQGLFGRDLIPSAHDVRGTFRCSEAFATIVPAKGRYKVVLHNSPGMKHDVVVEEAPGVSAEIEFT